MGARGNESAGTRERFLPASFALSSSYQIHNISPRISLLQKEKFNTSLLEFKIGGAALVFEKVGIWKHHFKSLIVRGDTCRLLRFTLLTFDL
jgi:hypothetical protein